MIQLAELLLEREVIFSEDLEKIFGKRKGEVRRDDIIAQETKTESSESAAE